MVNSELPIEIAAHPAQISAHVIGEVVLRTFGFVAVGVGISRVTIGRKGDDRAYGD